MLAFGRTERAVLGPGLRKARRPEDYRKEFARLRKLPEVEHASRKRGLARLVSSTTFGLWCGWMSDSWRWHMRNFIDPTTSSFCALNVVHFVNQSFLSGSDSRKSSFRIKDSYRYNSLVFLWLCVTFCFPSFQSDCCKTESIYSSNSSFCTPTLPLKVALGLRSCWVFSWDVTWSGLRGERFWTFDDVRSFCEARKEARRLKLQLP